MELELYKIENMENTVLVKLSTKEKNLKKYASINLKLFNLIQKFL